MNCYSKSDGPFDTTNRLTLKADTRQTIFIDINENDSMVAVLVSSSLFNLKKSPYFISLYKYHCFTGWIIFVFLTFLERSYFP